MILRQMVAEFGSRAEPVSPLKRLRGTIPLEACNKINLAVSNFYVAVTLEEVPNVARESTVLSTMTLLDVLIDSFGRFRIAR